MTDDWLNLSLAGAFAKGAGAAGAFGKKGGKKGAFVKTGAAGVYCEPLSWCLLSLTLRNLLSLLLLGYNKAFGKVATFGTSQGFKFGWVFATQWCACENVSETHLVSSSSQYRKVAGAGAAGGAVGAAGKKGKIIHTLSLSISSWWIINQSLSLSLSTGAFAKGAGAAGYKAGKVGGAKGGAAAAAGLLNTHRYVTQW